MTELEKQIEYFMRSLQLVNGAYKNMLGGRDVRKYVKLDVVEDKLKITIKAGLPEYIVESIMQYFYLYFPKAKKPNS